MSLELDIDPVPVVVTNSPPVNVTLPSAPSVTSSLITLLLDSTGANGKTHQVLLPQDALRTRAYVVCYDNPVIITDVHPAAAPEGTGTGIRPSGYLLTPVASQAGVASYTQSGSVATPSAGEAIVSESGIAPGTYTIAWLTRNSATPSANNNYELEVNGTVIATSNDVSTGVTNQVPQTVTLTEASNTISINAIAAETAATYFAQFSATPLNAGDVGSNDIEITGQNQVWVISTSGTSRVSLLVERKVTA